MQDQVQANSSSVSSTTQKEDAFLASVNELRTKVYEDLLQVMIRGLQDDKVNVEDSKLMAKFVVNNLDKVKTTQDVVSFLNELPKKWDLYRDVCVQLKYTEESKEDKKKLEDIQSKLHQFIQQT